MSATRTTGFLIAIALSMFASSSAGQGNWRKANLDRDWTRGRAGAYCNLFDPTTLTSFEGTVVDVGYYSPGTAASRGLVLTVAIADGAELNVHLGPAWFVSEQGVTFQLGDPISVLGSRVTHRKKKVVVAVEITKGMSTIRLRSLSGEPVWRAGRPSS